MIKKTSLLSLLFLAFMTLHAQITTSTDRSSFYIGMQIGSPIFWGDISSVGDGIRPGHGAGISIGYRATDWLGIEFGTDYMMAKLRPSESQVNDFIDHQGFIRYTQGKYKLGEVYSKVWLPRYGVRLPVRVLNIFKREGRFNIELAPQFYLNHFNSAIYDVKSEHRLIEGAPTKSTSYSFGGDLGLSYKIGGSATLFLRSSFSWISDDRFDALTSQPAWKDNLMLHNSLGLSFDLK